MPSTRRSMTKGVNAAARVKKRAIGWCKHDSGLADRDADRTGPHDSERKGVRSLITCACHDRSPFSEPRFCGAVTGDFSGDSAGLEHLRKRTLIQSCRRKHGLRPPPAYDVEHQGARSVRNVRDNLAGQPEPHVVFRQEYVPHATPRFRFVLPHPEQLRKSEGRHGCVAGKSNQTVSAESIIQSPALLAASLVAPDYRRPYHVAVLVQQHGAVHLP
jgi:hypothetical protein